MVRYISKYIKYIYLLLIIFSLFGCCVMFFKNYDCIDGEELKGWGTYTNIDNKIKIDGYYYYQEGKSIFIFYANGILCQISNYYNNFQYSKNFFFNNNQPYQWSSYLINFNKIELIYIQDIGGAYIYRPYEGRIDNDTTIIIIRESQSKKYEEIYHFCKMENKPDSSSCILLKNKCLQEKMRIGYEEFLKRKEK